MTIVQWSDAYKTGDREIDSEHWGLFALINDLSDKRAGGAAESSVQSTIDALVAYVAVHFEHEERLMTDTEYPETEFHKKAHARLAERVDAYQRAYQDDPRAFDFDEFMEFLSNWLKQHILNLDMDFAAYFQKRKATQR